MNGFHYSVPLVANQGPIGQEWKRLRLGYCLQSSCKYQGTSWSTARWRFTNDWQLGLQRGTACLAELRRWLVERVAIGTRCLAFNWWNFSFNEPVRSNELLCPTVKGKQPKNYGEQNKGNTTQHQPW